MELIGDDLGRFEVTGLDAEVAQLRGVVGDRGDTAASAGYSDSELHRRQIEDFVAAVAAGRAPAVDGAAGRATLEVMRAIYRSARDEAIVHLPLGADPRPVPMAGTAPLGTT